MAKGVSTISSFLDRIIKTTAESVAERVAQRLNDASVSVTVQAPPVKCPVCEGKGVVEPDFYPPSVQYCSTSFFTLMPTCRACGGKGVVSSPETKR